MGALYRLTINSHGILLHQPGSLRGRSRQPEPHQQLVQPNCACVGRPARITSFERDPFQVIRGLVALKLL